MAARFVLSLVALVALLSLNACSPLVTAKDLSGEWVSQIEHTPKARIILSADGAAQVKDVPRDVLVGIDDIRPDQINWDDAVTGEGDWSLNTDGFVVLNLILNDGSGLGAKLRVTQGGLLRVSVTRFLRPRMQLVWS